MFLFFILAISVVFFGFVSYSHFTDYRPKGKLIIDSYPDFDLLSDTLSILTWNIGYCGLGDDMDFFYDGGAKMQTSFERTQQNIHGILKTIESFPSIDFYLFQEVDVNSKRTYHINEQKYLEKQLSNYWSYFAHNYKVNFVPLPISNPLGKVESGLVSASKFKPHTVTRHSFLGAYGWPKSLFMLDRCFMVQEYPLSEDDTLFVVNTHNTAYDNGGLRLKQMQQLKQWLIQKTTTGNHVIVGGDWNQIPPAVEVDQFGVSPESVNYSVVSVPDDFLLDGWFWVYNDEVPTNRSLDALYTINSYTTILDYFLVSPGIEVLELAVIKQDFKYSDHEPVYLKFTIKPNWIMN